MTYFSSSFSTMWTGFRSSFPSPRKDSTAHRPQRDIVVVPPKAKLHTQAPNDTLHINHDALNPANRQYDDVWAGIYQTNKLMMDHLASADIPDTLQQPMASRRLRKNKATFNLRELTHHEHESLPRVKAVRNLPKLSEQSQAADSYTHKVNEAFNRAKAFLKLSGSKS